MNAELINNVWIILAIVAAMAACAGMVFLTAWIKQLCRHQTQRDATLSSLQNTINLLSREVLEARENRQQLQTQFKKLRAKRSQLEPNEQDSKPYSDAISMLKNCLLFNSFIFLILLMASCNFCWDGYPIRPSNAQIWWIRKKSKSDGFEKS